MFKPAFFFGLYGSAEIRRMQDDRAYAGWCSSLHGFAELEPLTPLRQILTRIAGEGLGSGAAFDDFLEHDATTITQSAYCAAADTAMAYVDSAPHASWVLSALAVLGWDQSQGPVVVFPRGAASANLDAWSRLPYAFAATSLAVGATRATEEILNATIPILWASTSHGMTSQLRCSLDTYASLERRASQRMTSMQRNLAEDIRAGCDVGVDGGVRPHVCALLWALGHVPESAALRAGDSLPTRGMCRSLVRESVRQVSRDPLLQALWVALAQSSSLPGQHQELFSLFSSGYYLTKWSWFWDVASILQLPPSVVAHILVDYFARRLSPDVVEPLLGRSPFLIAPNDVEGNADVLRIAALCLLLREEVRTASQAAAPRVPDHERPDTDGESLACVESPGGWAALTDEALKGTDAERVSVSNEQFPRTLGIPLFGLIDEVLSDPRLRQTKAVEALVDRLERLRSAPYRWLLTVNPPLPPVVSSDDADQLLAERSAVVEHIRTAYVLGLLPRLPVHYQSADVITSIPSDRSLTIGMSAYRDRAAQVMTEETQHLRELDVRIQSLASIRKPDNENLPALQRLACTLRRHAARSGKSGLIGPC